MKIKKWYIVAVVLIFVQLIYSVFACYSTNYQLMLSEAKEQLAYSAEITARTINYKRNMIDKMLQNRNRFEGDGYFFSSEDYFINSPHSTSVLICEKKMEGDDEFVYKSIVALEASYDIRSIQERKDIEKYDDSEIFYYRMTYDDGIGPDVFVGIDADGFVKKNDNLLFFPGGYQYIITQEGDFQLHPDKRLIGLNIYEDTEQIKELLSNTSEDLNQIALAISGKEGGFFHYNAYDNTKLGYSSLVDDSNLYLMSTFTTSTIKKNAISLTFRNLLPMILTGIVMIGVFLFYIFRIKYTDYETGAKNLSTFIDLVDKKLKKDGTFYAVAVLSVNDIIDNQSDSMIYAGDVYKDITKHFNKQNRIYDHFFRLSTNLYAFVKKSDDDIGQQFQGFYQSIHDEIQGERYPSFALRASLLETKINIHDVCSEKIFDDITKYLLSQKETVTYKYVDSYLQILCDLRRRDRLKSCINKVVAENRIVPFFQPIYNIAEGKVEKYEALMRIKEGKLYLPPMNTIEAAEEMGLISTIDQIMIEKVFLYSHIYSLQANDTLQLNLNLSGCEIDKTFVDMIIEKLEIFNINPKTITFEITESTAFENFSEVKEEINRLSAHGCKLAIDDFGKGYSNLEKLNHIKADYLKIDGNFIRGIAESEKDRKVLKALIDIAKVHELEVVAEYVESEDVLRVLTEMGVDYAQGYHLGKPSMDVLDCAISKLKLPIT